MLQMSLKEIQMDNVMVIYRNLPEKVNAFTMYHAGDDFYTIILNSRVSYDCAQRAFKHELRHIKNDDFVKFKNVGEVEVLTHA